jgi:hypothetical protein
MDYKYIPPIEHFKIILTDQKNSYVTVEDEELGLVIDVYPKRSGWTSAEIFKQYSVKFFFDADDAEVVTFMA